MFTWNLIHRGHLLIALTRCSIHRIARKKFFFSFSSCWEILFDNLCKFVWIGVLKITINQAHENYYIIDDASALDTIDFKPVDRNFYPNRKKILPFSDWLSQTLKSSSKPRHVHDDYYTTSVNTALHGGPREREREREVNTIRVHNRSDVTGEIDRPGWNHTDGERDTRVLGPRTRNSPEMTVPRALFRQSAARFIANFRASITETMAANRCPCIPPCTSVRHRDPIESWSPIKWKARLRIIHTSLIHGKNFSFQLFSSSSKKKKLFLFLPFLLSILSSVSLFSQETVPSLLSSSPSFLSRMATVLAFVSYTRSFAWKIVLLFRRKKSLLFSASLSRERNNFSPPI